jgi:hypothetical protein
MLGMLRAVARTRVYRTNVQRLRDRRPEDLWHEQGIGWLLTFALDSADRCEELLLFLVSDASSQPEVRRALHLKRDGDLAVTIRA